MQDIVLIFVVIAIIMSYANLWLLISREKPTIIINNNNIPKDSSASKDITFKVSDSSTTGEIPIDSTLTINDIKGKVNLENESVSSNDVSELTNKIKKLRKE